VANVAAGESGDVEISIVDSVEVHARDAKLTRICRAAWDVNGCTDFPVERLECHCERHGDLWMIDASAEIVAVIHLSKAHSDSRLLIHERLHLADLESGLHEHLAQVASRAYQSETACRTYARVLTESPHLRLVMNRIRERSNDKYQCSRKSLAASP